MQDRRHPPVVRIVIGLAIAITGVLFTLDNLHILRARNYLRYWPVALVAIGVAQIAQARTSARVWSGAIWIAIGGAMIADRVGLWDVNIWAFWPLALVLVGARIFWRAFRPDDTGDTGTSWAPTPPASSSRWTAGAPAGPWAGPLSSTAPTVSALAVMGGFDRKVASPAFRRAELTAFMGGGKLDLRESTLADGQGVVDVFAVMGGFEIRVPPTWDIVVEVTPFMGHCDDEKAPHVAGAPRLIVRGFVMMGGVDIKS